MSHQAGTVRLEKIALKTVNSSPSRGNQVTSSPTPGARCIKLCGFTTKDVCTHKYRHIHSFRQFSEAVHQLIRKLHCAFTYVHIRTHTVVYTSAPLSVRVLCVRWNMRKGS